MEVLEDALIRERVQRLRDLRTWEQAFSLCLRWGDTTDLMGAYAWKTYRSTKGLESGSLS